MLLIGFVYKQVILTSSQHITKSHEYDIANAWLGTGLLTSRGNVTF